MERLFFVSPPFIAFASCGPRLPRFKLGTTRSPLDSGEAIPTGSTRISLHLSEKFSLLSPLLNREPSTHPPRPLNASLGYCGPAPSHHHHHQRLLKKEEGNQYNTNPVQLTRNGFLREGLSGQPQPAAFARTPRLYYFPTVPFIMLLIPWHTPLSPKAADSQASAATNVV